MRARRTAAACLLIGALLLGANACQAESDADAVFRSSVYAGPELDHVLVEHHTAQARWWALEASSAITAMLALALARAKRAPALTAAPRSRRDCHPQRSPQVADAATNQPDPETPPEVRRPIAPLLPPHCHPDSPA